MTQNTRIHNRSEYHLEDLECESCLFYKRKYKHNKTGCGNEICRFEDIRRKTAANRREKSKRRWLKCQV